MPRLLAIALIATALVAPTASAATLKADYRFQGTRSSSVGGAPPLGDIGTGVNSFATEDVGGERRQVLRFPQGSGLALLSANSVVPPDAHTTAIIARLEEISGYRRYLDFSGGTSDSGLYNLNGALTFFGAAGASQAQIGLNRYHQIVLARNASGVAGYVDGRLSFTFADSSNLARVGSDLRFFKDDSAVAGEESAGAVSRIRLWEGALTPSEVAALGGPGQAVPPPVIGKTVNAQVVKGTVLIAVPAGAAGRSGRAKASQKGLRFVPLSQARQIPVGAFLDTRKGTVRLVSARGAGRKTQSGAFSAGLFQVLQARRGRNRGLTELRLKGSSFRRCRARGSDVSASRLSRRTVRRLRSNARGRFRTRGRYSAATVRGTVWTTTDRCDGTLTKVTRGRVVVRDFKRRRNVVVRAGKRYLARAPR